MSHISNALQEMYRTNRHIKPQRTNAITRARVKQYEDIKNATGEDGSSELDYSRQIVKDNLPIVQRYVLSQNETPASKTDDLIKQAYQLRCKQIDAVAKSMDVPTDEAEVWLEMDEADDMNLEVSGADSYLGSLFAPIGVAATRLQQKARKGLAYDPDYSMPDTLDPSQTGSIIGGVTQVLGGVLSGSELKRAAAGKPAGVIGSLSTGGSAHYNDLRAYFKANPNIAQQVLNGTITSESQLPNYAGNLSGANILNSNDITGSIADYQRKQQIKKMLPIIIIGVVAIIIITVLISRNARKS